jgi:hypothetical protein
MRGSMSNPSAIETFTTTEGHEARNAKQRQRYRSDPVYREKMKTRARIWKQAQLRRRFDFETENLKLDLMLFGMPSVGDLRQ